MSDDLKPCPACGHYATVYNTDIPGMVYVSCEDRDCSVCGPFGEDEEKAIAAWNALPRRLRWTKESPTDTGWYFFRGNIPGYQENNPPVYVDVQKDKVILTRHAPWILSILIDNYALEWAGPIQEPLDTSPQS